MFDRRINCYVRNNKNGIKWKLIAEISAIKTIHETISRMFLF